MIYKIVTVLSLYILAGCSCIDCYKEKSNIPERIRKISDNFIIKKTGKEFFDKYVFFDFVKSEVSAGNFHMFYKLSIPEKSFVNETMHFVIDSTGIIQDEYDIIGIPNCNDEPEECIFNLNENEIIKIAKEKGLEKGKKPWEINFGWSTEYGRYVWHILTVNKEITGEEIYKGAGEELILSPSDGSVISQRKWKVH